jgi:hypothetical protein
MTLPAAVTTQRLTVGGSVNNELERIWKEAVTAAYLRKYAIFAWPRKT